MQRVAFFRKFSFTRWTDKFWSLLTLDASGKLYNWFIWQSGFCHPLPWGWKLTSLTFIRRFVFSNKQIALSAFLFHFRPLFCFLRNRLIPTQRKGITQREIKKVRQLMARQCFPSFRPEGATLTDDFLAYRPSKTCEDGGGIWTDWLALSCFSTGKLYCIPASCCDWFLPGGP